MKYAVASEHRDFFNKNGAIEFDGLLNQEQLSQLGASVNEALSAKMKVPPEKLDKEHSEKQFSSGRDLWRHSPALKKLISHNRFAEIASELVQHKPLRLGYDQYFPKASRHGVKSGERHDFADLIEKEKTLNDISCLQGVLCGLMICIDGEKTVEPALNPEEAPQVDIFASKAGNGVFFSPEKLIDFGKLRGLPGHRYLLVVYTESTTLYVLRDDDPHTHALKRLGYVFGDKLSDKLNPIIYR